MSNSKVGEDAGIVCDVSCSDPQSYMWKTADMFDSDVLDFQQSQTIRELENTEGEVNSLYLHRIYF